MPDLKFSCPHCQQHIAAGLGYAGMQINCPACNGALTVPGSPPAPMPAPAPSLSIPGAGQAAVAPPSPLPVSAPSSAPAAPAPRPTPGGCPSCGNAMPRGAVLCTNCGYNTATRQRTVAGRPAAMGKPNDDQWETPWYKTALPYALGVLVILGTLYGLGRSNPAFMAAFAALGGLYAFGMQITAVVYAFKENVTTGLLTLLCFPYALYFVFAVNESTNLKVMYGSALPIVIAFKFGVLE